MSEKLKEFIEAYQSYVAGRESAGAIRSEDINAREGARAYALESAAENIPGFEDIAADPIAAAEVLKSDASVDKLLSHALLHFGKLSEQIFAKERKDIIASTPEKGLAEIVLNIPSLKTKGDKTSEAHAGYQDIMKLSGKDGQISHRELHSALMPHLKKRIESKLRGDPYLGKVKGLVEATMETARFVLAGSSTSCLNGVASLAAGYKKEFEDALPDDKAKANYAREVLTKMKDIPSAMSAVYAAELKAKKK